MKNEKRFVKYDKELQIEAYWFQGILQKFPQHFHEYYVLGFVEKSGLRHMCYDNVDYYITAGDVLLFNPCVPHNCEPMDNDLLDLRCLNIKPEIMSQFMQELTGSEEVPLFASPVLRGDELSGSLLRELHQMIMQEREDLAKEETFVFCGTCDRINPFVPRLCRCTDSRDIPADSCCTPVRNGRCRCMATYRAWSRLRVCRRSVSFVYRSVRAFPG